MMMAGDGGGGGNMCGQCVADCSGKISLSEKFDSFHEGFEKFQTLKTRQKSMKNVIKMLKFFQVQNSFQAWNWVKA